MSRLCSRLLLWFACLGCACGEAAIAVDVAEPLQTRTLTARSAASATTSAWGIPRFFEIGERVSPAPGEPPTDTTGWLGAVLARDDGDPGAHLEGRTDDRYRIFTYLEPDPLAGGQRRLSLILPRARPYHANGRVTAYWDQGAEAFNFGVETARSFGSVFRSAGPGRRERVQLKAAFQPSGTNVQAYELVYQLEHSALNLFEHKGLVPGLPVAFASFVLYDREQTSARDPLVPIAPGQSGLELQVGITPSVGAVWSELASFELGQQRVLYVTDAQGQHYFLAAPLLARPTAHLGDLTADLVADTSARAERDFATGAPAAALLLPDARSATLLCGKVNDAGEIADLLRKATDFLAAHEDAMRDLQARGDHAERFLRQYTHAFLDTHRSLRDPRAITELPYGDHFAPSDVLHSSANVWYGSDQASVLLGLVEYARRFSDETALEAIWGIAESSLEAMSPAHSTYMKRFDQMLVATESDRSTGRADVFIDNGGVSINFNHTRLVLRRGYERIAGATWGAFGLVAAGLQESVEDGRYRFSIDPESVPQSFATDQDQLSVSRLFTRLDGQLRVRETASVQRGVPAARIDTRVENIGEHPLRISELRTGLGDFFHYGDGTNEISQNRYGFSRVFQGVPLHVGFYMEGMAQPLWGDGFAPGWVDLTAQYRALRPRYLIVFGYDKAQLYTLAAPADRVLLYNAGPARPDARNASGAQRSSAPDAKDGYSGWTRLQVHHRVDRVLEPGQSVAAPRVESYTLWAPLYSADADAVPDALQELAPLWLEILQTVAGANTHAAIDARLRALPDRARAARVAGLLHTSLETDYAYAGMQAALMQAADLFRDLALASAGSARAELWQQRHLQTRAAALAGAEFSLRTLQQLRARSDLMPAFGIMRYYGFHVPVFDWAFRETCDVRFREAMLQMADQIARDERLGGLQIKDPSKPNHGGFLINEFSRASGANNLDDQGIKLWALRIAHERTADPSYRKAAELNIEHWIRVREQDDHFFGITKLFDRYAATGLDQQRTPYGHYTLLAGLHAWSDVLPRARELYARGLQHATRRHTVHSVGTSGAYHMVFTDEGNVHFGTNAELGGTFLWALTLDPARLVGRAPACRGAGGQRSVGGARAQAQRVFGWGR